MTAAFGSERAKVYRIGREAVCGTIRRPKARLGLWSPPFWWTAAGSSGRVRARIAREDFAAWKTTVCVATTVRVTVRPALSWRCWRIARGTSGPQVRAGSVDGDEDRLAYTRFIRLRR